MESLHTTLELLSKLATYYTKVHFQDPLVLIVISFHLTVGVFFIAARRKPLLNIALLAGLLVLVLNTRQIHILLSMNQPQLLDHKLISMRYFDDEGSFSVFLIAIPVFAMAMLGGVFLIFRLAHQLWAVKRDQSREETDKKHD